MRAALSLKLFQDPGYLFFTPLSISHDFSSLDLDAMNPSASTPSTSSSSRASASGASSPPHTGAAVVEMKSSAGYDASSSPPPSAPILQPFGPPGHARTRLRETLAVACLICAMLTTQAALGIVVVPLEIIGRGFGVADSPGEMSWCVYAPSYAAIRAYMLTSCPSDRFAAAYSLTTGTFILPAGRLGDMFGHKRIVVIGYAWTCVWALAAGFSSYATHTPVVFDVCRGFQGIGYSLLLPNAVALMARCTHDGHWKRAVYFTLFAATAPNGFLLGALFSSLIAQFHPNHWEFAFYLAAVCLAGLCVVAILVLPSDAYLRKFHGADGDDDEAGARIPLWKLFDLPGALLAISGLVLFNFSWNQAGVVGWSTAYNPVLLVVGLILIGLFLYYESRHAAYPLIPKTIWTTRNTVILGCVALGWSSFGIWNFYSVRWWIQLRGATPLSAVAMASPCGIAGCVAAGLSVFLLSRIGPGPVMLAALCAFCAANALLATMPIQQIYWAQSFPSFAIAPLGMDMSFPSACLILASALPQRHQGVAASVVNTIVNYSVALGLGIAGTVESRTSGPGQQGKWEGYRNALFLGTGLAGLGVVLALANVIVTSFVRQGRGEKEVDEGRKVDAASM